MIKNNFQKALNFNPDLTRMKFSKIYPLPFQVFLENRTAELTKYNRRSHQAPSFKN